jgi:hypothetical protein
MKTLVSFIGVSLGLTLFGCGSSLPPPSDRLASAEAATRSARELGAERDPKASLHLKLAEEQVDKARTLMKESSNEDAERVLQRASADAELSLALAKERIAEAEAAKAVERMKALKGGQ